MTFTRQQTKMTKKAGYKFMPTIQTFDYLPLKSKDTYTMNFRIVRFAIADNSYEMLVTNLSQSEFSTNDLKEMILSILVDTFISKISLTMQPGPKIDSISGA